MGGCVRLAQWTLEFERPSEMRSSAFREERTQAVRGLAEGEIGHGLHR